MVITIELPGGVKYFGTTEWVLDEEGDGQLWTVGDLNSDVSHACRAAVSVVGVDESILAIEAFSDGDVVTFAEG